MKKIWYNWSKPKKIISIICICLCSVFLAGCVITAFDTEGKLSSKFNEYSDKVSSSIFVEKVRNDQNILDPSFYAKYHDTDQKGVRVTVNGDGSITLNGTATGKSNLRLYEVSDLEAYNVTYTIGNIDFGSSAKSSRLFWRHGSNTGGTDYYEVFSFDSKTFTCTQKSGETYSMFLSIENNDVFDNVTIYPVLNYGFEAQPFYVEEKSGNIFGNLIKTRNDENLIDLKESADEIEGNYSGVVVTVNKDGSLTLDGTATASDVIDLISLQDRVVAKEFYSIARLEVGPYADGTYLSWTYGGTESDGNKTFNVPIGYDYSFQAECAEPTGDLFTLSLNISAGDRFNNVTIYPVLNTGTTVVSYFK